jgi:hypothetical protein
MCQLTTTNIKNDESRLDEFNGLVSVERSIFTRDVQELQYVILGLHKTPLQGSEFERNLKHLEPCL